jgi:hypothetical protein
MATLKHTYSNTVTPDNKLGGRSYLVGGPQAQFEPIDMQEYVS